MEDLLDGIFEVLGDFWFELFAPVQIILGLLLTCGVLELVYHFTHGGWVG